MAWTVNSNVTEVDGARNVVRRLVATSDTSTQLSATIVDASALSGAPSRVDIERLDYSVKGSVEARILFDATADDVALSLSGDGSYDFTKFGGIQNPMSSGATGDIVVTTVGTAAANNAVSIVLHGKKK